MVDESAATALELKVAEIFIEDVGKGLARLDPVDAEILGATLGDVVEIKGEKRTVARMSGIFPEHLGKKIVQMDGITRDNAGVLVGGTVQIRKVTRQTATAIVLTALESGNWWPDENELGYISKILQGLAVISGDRLNIPLFGGKDRFFSVIGASPSGPVIINQQTKFKVNRPDYTEQATSRITYEDIGGLERELRSVREMVEIPLRYGELFERLGIEAPKGLLLYGPPGTGKTLIARAIAGEAKLHFIRINGPEIIQKYYGDSEARLREIFEEATRKAPSVIFIDEMDAIAPKRAEVVGDVEKRVVAQLLALMDGTVPRGHVLVIGATNVPEMIDPALRRPGRFDREISISAPHADGRLAILKIHSRRMPLAPDVDLHQIAQITHGFVGADIEALCKEAGMSAVRRYLPVGAIGNSDRLPVTPEHMQISMDDFLSALREVEPTATRQFFNERSAFKLSDIGGLTRIKETLISIVDWPLRYPDLFALGKISSHGILLSGPSGTGKTLMVKALAGETGLNFIPISSSILFSKWLGESEKALHEIFKKAKQSAPTILFFDEIDALAPRRGAESDSGAVERMASQFFNELDALSDLSQVVVIGATNREDLLDPALTRPGRLDFILRFQVPDEKERLEIFQINTKGRPLGKDVDLKDLARKTEGMVGSSINFICKRAVMLAITEIIHGKKKKIPASLLVSAAHFKAALQELRECGSSGQKTGVC
ncbi:MAG: CDC48 family AAA ATPase [Syntrophales bacterium]|nr:CDC48 family AAA ATPase [Syntrophales bacterium]